MDKYIIWGAGYQGSIVYELLKNDVNIMAFIDNNSKLIGTKYKDLKVISFEEYLNFKESATLIISPRKSGSIIDLLKKNNIDNYVVLSDLNNIDNFKDISNNLHDIIKTRIFNLQRELISSYISFKYLHRNSQDTIIDWKEQLSKVKYPVFSSISNKSLTQVFEIIFRKQIPSITLDDFPKNTDLLICYGLTFNFVVERLIMRAEIEGISLIFAEDGLLYGIANKNIVGLEAKYTQSHSTIIDDKGLYINATGVSNMEAILNSDFQLSETQRQRAINLINIIKSNKISKYNHQPIMKLNIGKSDRKKVLVIDQVFADQSINYGWANEQTFTDMLEAAITENPDADILVKTHPEGNVTKGYFTDTKFEQDNVYKISFGINPISLLEQVDKVYVCTSQMGFEALMCGKEVHVFGMPFYAGWNAANERLKCPRRTKMRSVEEIFYAAYIMCSVYVSYKTNSICEIEQAIDEILELREEYFSQYKD